MSRHRPNSKRPPPEIGLHMECEEEELEPSQISYYNKAEKEYNEVQAKLDNYIKKMKAEIVEKGENCTVLQFNASSSVTSSGQMSASNAGGKSRQAIQSSQNYQQISGQGIITRSNANASTNTYLVMDPRLGFMVGQIQSSNTPAEVTTSTSSKTISVGRSRQQTTPGSVMVTTRAKSNLKKQSSDLNESETLSSPITRTRQHEKTKSQAQQSSPQTSSQQQQIYSAGSSSSNPGSYKIKVNAKPSSIQPTKPSESSALGGLSVGGKVYKGTGDDSSNSKSTADSREVTFSRLTGKIFPSLVVTARPHLKLKYIPQSTIQQERSSLDTNVKGVLMYSSTKFIEWLIQQGLIRSEQSCQTHVNNDLVPVKLKLGLYSDVTKFPYSGGYVWISDCCPQQFVSMFSGSIFEGAPHPPTTLLKLIYHWACQTNVQNVVQWVKIDNLYLKNFYTNMRAVCTQAVHEKFKKLGGPRKKIEVGVISLGTTSQDGNKRQVKVEVLGVMDQENKAIRLRAVEPLSEERSFKRRFVKILEPLEDWAHKDSIILTDFTVAKAALNAMGFNSVYQVTNDSKLSNQNVMEYLRRIVPRMFQNTLSLLSRQIIQQFLDELVWREMWGPIPSQAFVTIISHLAEQTKLDVTENLLVRLNKVATNPFKKWNYSVWKRLVPGTTRAGSKSQQKSISLSQDSISEVMIENSEISPTGKGIRTRKRTAEQPLSEILIPPISAKKVAKGSGKEKQKKEDKILKKESIDKLSDEVIKFINDENQVSLERYFYGSKNGDEEIIHSSTGSFNVKCCVCNKRFFDNIVLMKHMILHCQAEPPLIIDLKKVHQCDNCFLGFNTSASLKVHLQEVHSEVDGKIESNLICHICEEKFNSRVDLIYHMHRTHIQLEMPYECGACRFRTSVYKVFVDHFTKVHKNEEHVFCPYCLKLITFSYKGKAITTNVFFYMSHLEKHQRLTLVKDCNCCQLSFIHKGILDQHMEADHGSWKNESGVIPIEQLPTGILMPEPGEIIKSSPVIKPFKCSKSKNMFAVSKFKSIEICGMDENMACVECEGSLTFSEHFMGNFNCLKCRYTTCCEKAIVEHFAIFHESSHPQFTMGKPVVLPQEMFCVCGFSTSSGNRIAKHLALCERETAYQSRETALAAVLSKEDSDFDEKSKQGDGQNVLNMLGLVRKSPEAIYAGSSNESLKIEAEDEEDLGVESEVKQEAIFEVPGMSSQEESDASDSQQDSSIIASTVELSKQSKNSDLEGQTQWQSVGEKTQAEDVETEVELIPLVGEENFNFKNPSEAQLDVCKDLDVSKNESKTESTSPAKEKTERTYTFLEAQLDVCKDLEVSKDESKIESTSPAKEKTERTYTFLEAQLDVCKDLDVSKDESKIKSTGLAKEKTESSERKEGMVIDNNGAAEREKNDQTLEVQLSDLSKDIKGNESTEVADEEMKTEDVGKSEELNDISKIEEGSSERKIRNNIDEDVSNAAEHNRNMIETCDIITEKSEAVIENMTSSADVKCLEVCLEKNVAQEIHNANVEESG